VAKKVPPASDLNDAASAGSSLQGYAAVNQVDEHEEIARLAYQYSRERGEGEGSADEDWFRAEQEVRRRRGQDQTGTGQTTAGGRSGAGS
jgi:hypothetical protein